MLLECSLVSLQAIQQALGPDSPQAKAATKITMQLVQIVRTLLSEAYSSRSAMHVPVRSCCAATCCCCAQTAHLAETYIADSKTSVSAPAYLPLMTRCVAYLDCFKELALTFDKHVKKLLLCCRLATQVVLLGDVPEPFDSVKGLVQWQEAHRRRLLQSKRLPSPSAAVAVLGTLLQSELSVAIKQSVGACFPLKYASSPYYAVLLWKHSLHAHGHWQ